MEETGIFNNVRRLVVLSWERGNPAFLLYTLSSGNARGSDSQATLLRRMLVKEIKQTSVGWQEAF